MDGISAAASVIAVIEILLKTITVTGRYIDTAKKSATIISSFLKELQVLLTNLQELDAFLQTQGEHANPFSQTSLLVIQMTSCGEKLIEIRDKLEGVLQSKIQKAIWPLSEKEYRQSIDKVMALSKWISLSLSVDSSILLAKTADEVMKIQTTQMECLRQLNSISTSTLEIQTSLKVQEQAFVDYQRDERTSDLLLWLSKYDENIRHLSLKELRTEGTGHWLMETQEFRDWIAGDANDTTFWCYGDPGVGKSTLMSLVIDRLKQRSECMNQSEAVVFFYFEQEKRTNVSARMVIGSLAKQILLSCKLIRDEIWHLYTTKKGSADDDLFTFKAILLNALSQKQTTYVVLDALDECDIHGCAIPLLEILDGLRSRHDVRLLVSSRTYCAGRDSHSRHRFPPDEYLLGWFRYKRKLAISAKASDLKQYLTSKLDNHRRTSSLDQEFKATIIDAIVRKAGNMFLLAALQIRDVLDSPSIGDMKEACELLPSTLEEAFGGCITRIKALTRPKYMLAWKTLIWIGFKKNGCMLRMRDLIELLAVKKGQAFTDNRYHPSAEWIIECCQGLITFDRMTEYVGFSHSAILQYIQDRGQDLFSDAHESISETCIEYLRTASSIEVDLQTAGDVRACVGESPFLWYAAANFGHHARLCSSGSIMESSLRLLQVQARKNCILQIFLFLLDRREAYWTIQEADSYNVLHMASLLGLNMIVRDLLSTESMEVDAVTSLGTTALMLSAFRGHTDIMKMLIDKGASREIMNLFGNALHCAAEAGQAEAIETFFADSHGTSSSQAKQHYDWIVSENRRGFTALECAKFNGHQHVIKLLSRMHRQTSRYISERGKLEYSINEELTGRGYNSKRREYSGILISLASDNLQLVRTLLAFGASPDGWDFNLPRPLAWAAWFGKIDATRLLLEVGADVSTTSSILLEPELSTVPMRPEEDFGKRHTAYWFAAARRETEIQSLLVEFGSSTCPMPDENDIIQVEKAMSCYLRYILESKQIQDDLKLLPRWFSTGSSVS